MLEPAELAQFAIAGLGELLAADGAIAQAEELAPAFIEIDRPQHPAAPALLGIQLVAQPLQIAGCEQVGLEQVAAQFRPAATASQHFRTHQIGGAHKPVGQQQLQVEYGPRFIGRQQLAVHQQGLGAHQGGEHCLGIGQFGVAADQVATADQAVCHRFEAALAGKLHVGIHQAAKGLLAQLRLPPLPAFLQGLEGCGIGQEPLAKFFHLMQQGPQQVTAALATEALEGQQLATVIA